MFGRMMISPTVQVEPETDVQATIAALLEAAEQAEIVRWIEFPVSVLLFLMVPGDAESGAVYVLDRKQGIFYAIDFDDQQYGGYSVAQFEALLKECSFLSLVERPGLLRTGLPWVLEPGKAPEARV